MGWAAVHADPTTQDEFKTLDAGSVFVALTVVDGDDDDDAEQVDISGQLQFYDDAPTDFTPDSAVLANEAGAVDTEGLDTDQSIDNNVGADGFKSIVFTGTDGTILTGLVGGETT